MNGSVFDVAIIGIGLNLYQLFFNGDAPNPISLVQIIDKEINQNEIMNHILLRFKTYYDAYRKKQDYLEISQRYLNNLYRLNEMAIYNDNKGDFRGEIVGVDKPGFLLIKDDQSFIRRYAFKEVRYKNQLSSE